jgi:hypothetical protein
MRFATLAFEASKAKRPQLVAHADHPVLRQFQLVIPNANADGTVKVRVDE